MFVVKATLPKNTNKFKEGLIELNETALRHHVSGILEMGHTNYRTVIMLLLHGNTLSNGLLCLVLQEHILFLERTVNITVILKHLANDGSPAKSRRPSVFVQPMS